MTILSEDFVRLYRRNRAKYGGWKASQAYLHTKSHFARQAWREANGLPSSIHVEFNQPSHVIERDGYRIELLCQTDENLIYDEVGAQGYHAEWQHSRHNTPDFFREYGANFQRDHAGDYAFCVPVSQYRDTIYLTGYFGKDFIDQWRTCKSDFPAALERAKEAIEHDAAYYSGDFACVGVRVFAPDGEEIYSDYLGGCDYEYAESLDAHYEHDMLDRAKDAIRDHFAGIQPQMVSANYQHAWGI